MSFRFAAFDAPTSTDGPGGSPYSYGGSETPTGCIIAMCRGGTAPNSGSDAVWSYGACDGTNEWVASGVVVNENSGGRYKRYTTDSCVLLIETTAGNVEAEMSFVSFGTGKVTLACTDAFPGSAGDYKLLIMFWTGADFECGVQTSPSYPQSVTTSFRPDGLICVHAEGIIWTDTASSVAINSIGFAGWDSLGTLTQGSTTWQASESSGTYFTGLYTSSTSLFQTFNLDTSGTGGTLDDDMYVSARSATSFTIAQDGVSTGQYDFGWAVFSDTVAKSVVVAEEKFSAGSGDQAAFTGYDGTIEGLIAAPTINASIDTLVTNFASSAVGIGCGLSDSEEFCQFVSQRDGSPGTTKSGHSTELVWCEGFTLFGTKRRQRGQLATTSFATDDEWFINRPDSSDNVAAYFVVMAICTAPVVTYTVNILGNTTLLGNTTIAGA